MLKTLEDRPIEGHFLFEEIQPINTAETFVIEKLLDKYKTVQNKKFRLVKWENINKPTYLPVDQIKDYLPQPPPSTFDQRRRRAPGR